MKLEIVVAAVAGAMAHHVYRKLQDIERAIEEPQVIKLGIDGPEAPAQPNPVGFTRSGT